jgi:acetolactate decarboxylase
MQNDMYQVSTLQALALGYSRAVITAGELLRKGDTGLGTFEDVDGEMIVMDGQCYRADQNGAVTVVASETGVPFAAVAKLTGNSSFLSGICRISHLCERSLQERSKRNSA